MSVIARSGTPDRSPAGGTEATLRVVAEHDHDLRPAERLGDLLHLASVGRSTLTFETVKDFAHPGRMALELAMGAGVEATFKAPQLIKAVTLLRAIADQQEAVTFDDLSRELGRTFLQSATRHDVDFNDQAARWEAFCMLERFDPIAATRRDPVTIAQASVVLHDPKGSRINSRGF